MHLGGVASADREFALAIVQVDRVLAVPVADQAPDVAGLDQGLSMDAQKMLRVCAFQLFEGEIGNSLAAGMV